MEIQAWVYELSERLAREGQPRLAYELVHWRPLVEEGRIDEVEALAPELLASVRDAKEPWAEVYVRHWFLNARLRSRYDVGGLRSEARAITELADSEPARACPQSICAAYDLAVCEAAVDAPASAQTRLDVTSAALDRIDPRWPCFRCLSRARASALIDLGRPEDALAFLDVQSGALGGDATDLAPARVDALLALGRAQDVLPLTEGDAPEVGHDRTPAAWQIHQAIDRARALIGLSRFEEARAALPTFQAAIEMPSSFTRWAAATAALAEAGHARNDWELDLQLRVMAFQLEDVRALHDAAELQHRRGTLALARERPWVAAHAVEALQRIDAARPASADAAERTAALAAAVGAAPDAPDAVVADSPDANLAVAGKAPDLDYERLKRALERWPGHEELWLGWSRAAGVLGRASEIVAAGRAFSDRNPDAWQVGIVVGQTLVALGDLEAAEAWAEALFERVELVDARASARFVQALAAEQAGDLDRMKDRLEAVIALDPDARNSRAMLATLARNRGDYDVALEHLDRLVTLEPETSTHHWDRIVAATMEDRWDVVRASGTALGMSFSGEDGPVEENWGVCQVQLRAAGTPFELHAVRTGPVTARVIEISAPELPDQFFDAHVVFDPRPLNPPSKGAASTDEDDEPTPLIFPMLDILNASPYRAFSVDGVRPSDVQLSALGSDLDKLGVVVQLRSGPDYEIQHPDHGAHPGAYWYVALPDDAPLEPLAERLETLADALDGPLVWPQLAAALGQDERAEAHRRTVSEWGLM